MATFWIVVRDRATLIDLAGVRIYRALWNDEQEEFEPRIYVGMTAVGVPNPWNLPVSLAVTVVVGEEYNWSGEFEGYTITDRSRSVTLEETWTALWADEVLLSVNTQLALTLIPSTVEPSRIVAASGYLTRTDTGAAVVGATVNLYDTLGTFVGSAITDSAGYFQMNFNAPSIIGIYTYEVRFPGGDF